MTTPAKKLLTKIINFLMRHHTVDQVVASFDRTVARLNAAAERELVRAEKHRVAALAAAKSADAAQAEAKRADRIADRFKTLLD